MAVKHARLAQASATPPFALHANKERLAALETALAELDGQPRLLACIELAWYLRQADSHRAASLADEAAHCLAAQTAISDNRGLVARLALLRAEIRWLFAELDQAEALLAEAMQAFAAVGDQAGRGDGFWLDAFLRAEHGDSVACEARIVDARTAWQAAGDKVRADTAQARLIFYHAFKNPADSAAMLARDFTATRSTHPVSEAWLLSARANIANMQGDPGSATGHYTEAFHLFLEYGQWRSAIIAGNNCAVCFEELGDNTTALEWNERALELALKVAWPGMIGTCRTRTGNALRLLGRFESAERELKGGLAVMGNLKKSHNYAVTLRFLGDLALDIGDHAAALDWNSQLEERAAAHQEVDLLIPALRGQARAFAGLDRMPEALAKAEQALQLAVSTGNAAEEVKILHTMARLFRNPILTPPAGMSDSSAELHFLEKALSVAAKIESYVIPAELLEDTAAAQAALGDFQAAYRNSLRAAVERKKAEAADANKRALALQIRHETERARAEATHQRQLAETESRRAQSLQQTAATLETLGQIGRDLTANLDAQAIFLTLQRHVHDLLDTSSFFIYLVDDSLENFHGAFAVEDDQPIELPELSGDDRDSNVVRCARERREIAIDLDPRATNETQVPGTLETVSLLYSPLTIGPRLLGVMSIQSVKPQAYGEREASIFRTLCSYTAIALDNALAYQELEEANDRIQKNREQLLAAEKMASLGRLTAGIAHEINTPLATVRTSLEEMKLLIDEYDKSIGNGQVGPDDHHAIAADMKKALDLATRAGDRAATFIRSIKTQTRETNQNEKITFNAVSTAQDALSLLDYFMRPKAVKLTWSGHERPLPLCGSPGKFAQVVTNLVVNAVEALPPKGGCISLDFANHDGLVDLAISDNGSGIDPAVQTKIFDPLFTTKRFGESTGLGLTIVRDIVTGTFNGSIEFTSQPGNGTRFTVRLPTADNGTCLPT
ncbi:MAG: hypothetical protein A2087_01705 [Spirochaetes bacterium GWD1_61_31]|nr:MAG: hypothetical protein A2Y37_10070 [Spirochaetes bacterium GWB1_60_80]OHD29072.1 MAG: hypothetical protein A2004_14580 [Spirochaetes bacterium GWC1_61_12]OHD35897.1 MAG: hypothetical protein A2087_01705 [Spirochaetes bacterium GWD1_61_31]OHD44237.1 MAG: hypothetical protein A2Y35_06775 [Spirochaetes bacterium GWE1_60_18]OHD60403.1 MAG: hypothetical protein A2Y32_00750 [Spirochaetes bacterium GWF1_60_12]HAP43281.1 GGDEF domain-containing protein [Spirochaetaceae bacterium]